MEKRIKVFVIGPRGFPNVQGGIERFSEEIYPRLVELGCDVTSCAIKRYCKHPEWKGIKFIYIPTPKMQGLEKFIYTFFSTIMCIVKRPDIVHIHSIASGFFIFLIKLFGLKIVVRYNSRDYLHSKWSFIGKWILKNSEKQFLLADYITTNSENYLNHFRKLGRESNISFIPNGVTIYEKEQYESCINNFKNIGIQKSNYIISVGRLTPEKNYDTLINAFLKLTDIDIKLVIAGDIVHKDNYSTSIMKRFASNKKVIFIGKMDREKLNCLYANTTLFILPSLFEGMPNVLLEAMSFNCNILVSNIPAHKEFSFDDESYFNVKDVDDLYVKMKKKIIANENCNYGHILKKHNWKNVAGEVMSVYRKVLND